MKRKYHAIPVLMYVPVDIYPNVEDAYDYIKTPLDMEAPDVSVFLAEDYSDGLVELDPAWTEFTAKISVDCNKTYCHVDNTTSSFPKS